MDPISAGASDGQYFEFEADFVASLRCVPMQVRLKLDTCGVKLKLEHWHRLALAERDRLATLPCHDAATAAAYRDYVQGLVTRIQGTPAKLLAIDPHSPWLNETAIPAAVQTQAAAFDLAIALDQWRSLTPLQRFALLKLSRPGHENRNFYPALVEFGLASSVEGG